MGLGKGHGEGSGGAGANEKTESSNARGQKHQRNTERKAGLRELGLEEVMELTCYMGVRGHSGEADSTSHRAS